MNLIIIRSIEKRIKFLMSTKESYELKQKEIYGRYALLETNGQRTGLSIAKLFIKNNYLKTTVQQESPNINRSSYSPKDDCIYLNERKYKNFDFQSVAIAAHECGHAWMYCKQQIRYSSLVFVKLMGATTFPEALLIANSIFVLVYILDNNTYWFAAIKFFPVSLIICAFLRFAGNYCKEENERSASRIGLNFLCYTKLIDVNEIEGIKEILEYSLLNYKKKSFDSWVHLSIISLTSGIFIGLCFLVKLFIL